MLLKIPPLELYKEGQDFFNLQVTTLGASTYNIIKLFIFRAECLTFLLSNLLTNYEVTSEYIVWDLA